MNFSRDMQDIADSVMTQLLDLYMMNDWECNWVQFLERFTEGMSETIGHWQMIDDPKEEEE